VSSLRVTTGAVQQRDSEINGEISILRGEVAAHRATVEHLRKPPDRPAPAPKRAPRKWDAYSDPASGRVWWWCEETQEATFDCPPEVAAQGTAP
jgi:hypothetical protein